MFSLLSIVWSICISRFPIPRGFITLLTKPQHNPIVGNVYLGEFNNELWFLSYVVARCCADIQRCGGGEVSTAWSFWDPHKPLKTCTLLPLSSLWETVFSNCMRTHRKGARAVWAKRSHTAPRICKFFLFFKTLWRKVDFLVESKCLRYCLTALRWFDMLRLQRAVGGIEKWFPDFTLGGMCPFDGFSIYIIF